MAEVTLEDVSKIYGEDVLAVNKMNLDIPDGEFVVFVGPSGCGKSTALRMIAGLEDISSGKVFIGDTVVNDLPPRERDIAMVFQNYALYPHMDVRENMGFALKLRKMDKAEIDRRVNEAARILSIERFLDRKPKALSGGQRQRVALGRAIVREPKAFLMDEPLSNLDAKLRVQMRTEIAKLHNRIGVTTIYVTHDQTEAMTMADRIVVLKDGVVQQIAPPQVMYDDPNNVFVAGFIGSPAMNFIRARLERKDGILTATFGPTTIPVGREVIGRAKERGKDPESFAGREVILGIRPEHMEDASVEEAPEASGGNVIEIEPQVIESMGSEKYVYFEAPGATSGNPDSGPGEENGGNGEVDFGSMLVARVSAASQAHIGQKSQLVIDTSKVRLFDAESEEAIL
ncbi:ABC-type sugar transport systems ATPase component [Rubrobacter radiotolerans]|uniref:ABC-type sugar transport systems ATPase component n=1 Tax=Rubrobacter radiotolerans TaxID=42256 RepID=A0A023X405_RUBRA|nr:sn-glycerol-3-phosphate ABC transporter ATP-binding protein UgpC [Rubrobacter radiotolerans]AHY47053.1 ABC-type sugar transport systems ATPase component [Rubrobacter radiotolerans]MDX5894459.1 sn-glycerol-3-phosphate ABC transporter ATP-binding protein UgpC [Rubrobacter radiotolerans]SMC06050.1 carbohydrate ABC transporter ATP-binding protein, CUT1 family [Rubrobacter radiotolerans DSM 5868]